MARRLHQIHRNVNHFALDIDTLDLLPIGEDGDVHTETTSELSLWPHTEANTHILNERHLEKITLCVSNDCNLRCKYCYAGGGDYGSVRSLMDKNTATKFIEFCCNNYRKIDKIMFFGGEPRLNPDIIAYICEEFEKKAVDSKFPLPSFREVLLFDFSDWRIETEPH